MDWKPKEVVIELAGDKNQQFVFDPLGARLRGRWTRVNVMEVSSNTDMGRMPDIPGICVGLDYANPKNRVLRAVDPLGFPENESLLEESNRITARFLGKFKAWDPITKRGLSDGDTKSTLWKMRELVDANKARVLHGELPSRRDILAMPGQLRLRWGAPRLIDPVKRVFESPYATEDELQALTADGESVLDRTRPSVAPAGAPA